jgi:tetratricopeptide (TPR) repeat protein
MLRALAEIHPLLLILDDLQWADAASIGLLFHLGRRMEGSRILIAGAYRPEEVALGRDGARHPLDKVISELRRTYGDVQVDLTEVKEPEERHFVDALLETEPNRLAEDFKRALFEQTGGHALFTVELLRAMQERGDLVQEEGTWIEGTALDWETLPARVEAVIEERIDRLEDELRDILSVASVEGEQFTAQVVARVQETGERQLFRSLSHHLERRHRLVRGQGEQQVGPRSLSRYRFAHALFQQYLYNGLSRGECRLLHGEIAAVLEELYKESTDEIAAQLARHFDEAGDDQRALRYLSQAAGAALAAYAAEEAEGHYRRALELERNDSQRAPLLAGLGEALSLQSRFDEAIQTYRQGIDLYKALGDLDGVAAGYARAAQAAWWGVGPPQGLRLCQEGLEAVANAPESPNLCLLLHEAARAHHFAGHPVRAQSLCQQALEMAERLGAVELRADALVTWGILPDKTREEAIEALERAAELAEEAGLLHVAGRALNNLGVIHYARLGDYRTARHYYGRAAAGDRQVGNITSEIYCLANLFEASAWLGDFEEAEASLQRIRDLLGRVDDPGLAGDVASIREALILICRGDWAEAVRLLRACHPASRRRGLLASLENVDRTLSRALLELCALGAAAQEADWDEAIAALAEAIEIGEGVRYPQEMVWSHCCLSVISAHRGQFEDARAKLAEARSTAGQQPNPHAEAAFLWAEATLAAAEQRWPEALAAFDALVAVYARQGMRWDWARTLIDWAGAHYSRGEPGDLERAQDLLIESQEMFTDMGIPRYAALAEERLEALRAR